MPHAESSEMLLGFRQVAVYREIIKQISRSANSTLVWGGILLALWFMTYTNNGKPNWVKMPIYGYIHLVLAGGELLVGFWKKIAPSPLAFLLDALVLLGFAATWGWRAFAEFQRGGRPEIITIAVTVYMLYLAYQQFQAWIQINRALIYRPTRAQLAQFNSLVKDVRKADPEADPSALDLRTRPGWRALLLGDIAFFVASTGTVVVTHKDEVDLEVSVEDESARNDDSKHAMLWLPGGQFGPFPLDPRNAANYLNWKANR